MAMSIRVLLVDDHAVVRQGYRRLIEMHEGIDSRCGGRATRRRAIKPSRAASPMSSWSISRCPGRGGIDLIRQIRQTGFRRPEFSCSRCMRARRRASRLFRAGARGYVTKSSPPEVLVSAISSVFEGAPRFAPRSTVP